MTSSWSGMFVQCMQSIGSDESASETLITAKKKLN